MKTLDIWAKRQLPLQHYIVVSCNSHSFRNIAQESWNWLQLGPKVLEKQQLCCTFQYWQKNISRTQDKKMHRIKSVSENMTSLSIGPCFLEERDQKAGVGTRGPCSELWYVIIHSCLTNYEGFQDRFKVLFVGC